MKTRNEVAQALAAGLDSLSLNTRNAMAQVLALVVAGLTHRALHPHQHPRHERQIVGANAAETFVYVEKALSRDSHEIGAAIQLKHVLHMYAGQLVEQLDESHAFHSVQLLLNRVFARDEKASFVEIKRANHRQVINVIAMRSHIEYKQLVVAVSILTLE